MKVHVLFTGTLLIFCTCFISAQKSALQKRIENLDRVEDIMENVDAHYAEISEGKRMRGDETNYKHWARWGLYMSARTDAEGRAVDVQKYLRKARKSYQASSRSSTGSWFFRGPYSISGSNGSAIGIGRVDRIAFHPTDPNTLYAGTPSGGLLKSSNGGISWTPLTDNLLSTAVSGIVVSHDNPNIVYILTGDGDSGNNSFVANAGYRRSSEGVFVSFDGGINWYHRPLPITNAYRGFALAQDPNNANILIAATSVGIYRSTDWGWTWTQVRTGLTYEIKFRPGNSSYVYATQNGTFVRSIDGGLTWTAITNFDFTLPGGRVALSVAPGQSNRVYLLSGAGGPSTGCNGTNNTFGGMFISYNFGASFARQSNSPNIVESCCDGLDGRSQSGYDLAIGVATNSFPTSVVAGGIRTWRSINNGVNWLNAAPGRCSNTTSTGYVHADIHDIEYNPLNNTVYVCSDGGIVSSSNHGVDWIDRSDGVVASQIYHMAGTPNDLDNMMIGMQDNGTKRRNANTNIWDQVLSADGYDCIYYPGNATSGYLSWNTTVWRFSNNGSNHTLVKPSWAPNEFFPRVQVHNSNINVAFFGYSDIYKTTTGDSIWTNKGAAGNWDIESCPNNERRFYTAGGTSAFATTGFMWRSDDTGDTWTEVSGNLGYPLTNIRLTDIEVRPNASANVYVSFGGFSAGEKVYVSYDAGDSWSNMSGSLPNVPVNAIQVDNNRNVYIGTDIGVFFRGANWSDWVPYWHNLPIVPVTDLELYQTAGVIRAATFGRGVWESDTYSTCTPQIFLFSNIKGHKYYETSNFVSSSSIIYGGEQTNVTFKAGDHVTLAQGFQVGAGNRFRAYTKPCGVVDN